MSFGNVPADMLVGAVEKLLAKMDEAELADSYERDISAMPAEVFDAFVESLFTAFRERGESSEDAAEGAGTTLESIARRENGAPRALLLYARENPDLLKEATVVFIEQRPELTASLPAQIRDALAARFAAP